ncbi:hypothetical protein PC116_g3142 [Phytophthora cactorum]|uniref:Uncharacterized protein n=1 Tax=Phytophthora cactorum TaxID=29920 RepID=A0A8T1ERQ6_9STRA|nr:hypothetical protein Pcac1_g2726 [Phytophthora cactorum]KAG2928075.1 hypothetical protein PC114_g3282 [Phytophthora cactorum]KAG2954251.1 hypothetical protein PC117_g1383 [Phytophthora cactorum]KAG3023519.1 hypothetical protein PC120_g7533 [Phytophthora cactorum]KAG3038343.1 hypothetical protein PC119_g2955 [Phytophthora cactorum]
MHGDDSPIGPLDRHPPQNRFTLPKESDGGDGGDTDACYDSRFLAFVLSTPAANLY